MQDEEQAKTNLHEIEDLRRENLFLSRFLRRTQATKLIETFEDFHSDNEARLTEINSLKAPVRMPYRSRRTIRRSERNSASSDPGKREKTLEEKRLDMAEYEFYQSQLEYERMSKNARRTLENLRVLMKTSTSDEIAQSRLNRDVQNYVDRYRFDVGDEEFENPNLRVPAELVIKRIHKRIHSRTTVITRLRLNNSYLQERVKQTTKEIAARNDLEGEKGPIQRLLLTTKRDGNLEKENQLVAEAETLKVFQIRLQRNFLEFRQRLAECEQENSEIKRKLLIVQHVAEETKREINAIRQENRSIENDNERIKSNLDGLVKIPTVTDYAYILKQSKSLEADIQIWTERVKLAEKFLSQLTRQEKKENQLPLLRSKQPVID